MEKSKTKKMGRKKVKKMLSHILEQPVLYTPHSGQRDKIVSHVKKQLYERIKGNNKDLYFLTAFLDVSTQDEAIQSFRRENENLKNDLIKIAKNHAAALNEIIETYKNFNLKQKSAYEIFLNNNQKNFCDLLQNIVFRRLFETIPGRFWLQGLVLLFLILQTVYENNCAICIGKKLEQIHRQNEQDNFLNDLRNTKGVGDKVARWAITNVDGSRFVIDTQIAKTIRKFFPDVKVGDSQPAETVWEKLFGSKSNGNWENFTKEDFTDIFIKKYDYAHDDYQYLMFIVTQTFWLYGRDRCLYFDKPPSI